MQIKITGKIPEGLALKIKEVASAFDLLVEEETATPAGLEIEFSKITSAPQIHTSANACTDSCEG